MKNYHSSEFEQYIGLPWSTEEYDCMSFVRKIQADHFDIEMPVISIPDYDDVRGLVGLMNGHAENQNWFPIQIPMHGDLVLIRTPMHLGIWINVDGGGVLHCVRGAGVVYTKDSHWSTSGFGRKQYLRHWSKK